MSGENHRTGGAGISTRRRGSAFPYMMECFLKSRTESGNPSNLEYDEEDVNIYLVSLLCLLLDPVYYLQVQKYVADYDADIFEKVQLTSDKRLRYWVYKANADHLLVNLGVFGVGSEAEGRPGPAAWESPRQAADRGKTYYDFARCYYRSLSRCSRGLADVLGKLAHGFDRYVVILDHMRGEYLNIIETLSEGEIFHLQRELDHVKEEEHTKRKYDELLDLYLDWKKTGAPELVARMKAVAEELKALDPSFSFKIPE